MKFRKMRWQMFLFWNNGGIDTYFFDNPVTMLKTAAEYKTERWNGCFEKIKLQPIQAFKISKCGYWCTQCLY